MASNKTCAVNRTQDNQIESVLVRNPSPVYYQIIGEQGASNLDKMEEAGKNAKTNFIQSELYQNIKQQPFITSEQALDVYKSIYSDSILPTWENGTENGTPLTQEPMLTYRTDSGLITSNLSEALKNSSNFFETGFMNSKNEFESKIETPIYSRTSYKGQIQTAIKNDYLLPVQIAPNTYEAVDSMAAEVFNQELLVTNYNGFKRNGDTFEFGDFKPTLEKGTPRNIELQSRTADTHLELQSKRNKPKPTNYSKAELSNMIQSWMKKIGFSFTTIEAYKNNYKNKFGVEPDAQALIDLNNKVVAFLDGKITLDALAEEFSHLIIEAWDQTEIQRMLQTVQNTREYAEHAQVYREAYSKQISDPNELEQAVRKEVLGKMLANSLQQNFSLENRTETERNFFNRLSQILDQVINFIKSKLTNNLRNDIDMMSREITNLLYNEQLDSRLDLDRISGANVMYSLGNVGGSNYQSLLNKQSRSVKELMRDLNRGKKSLTNEATTALTAFQNALGTADSCIIVLEEHSEKGEVKSAELNSLIQATLLQDPLLRQLRSYAMKNDTDFYNKYKDIMSATLDKLAELEGLNSNIEETKDPETVLEEMSNKYADVSEKDLDEVKESLRGVNRDTGWLGKHFLHMGKTGNSIVNMLTMVVNDLVNKTRSEFMKDAREFGDKLLSKKDQLLNFVSGRYFKSKVDQEAIIRDKFQYELDILKKVAPDTYANKTLEQYLEEFPNGNRPTTSSDSALYYKFEYEYRKNLSEQKWESESRRKYQKDFIDRLESIFPGQDVSETLLFKNLINYENSSRKTNYINKRAIRKILLEGRREDTNPYLSGGVKQGLTPMFYYEAKRAVQEGKVDASNVVSTNPNFELFKDGAKQPKDSDLVFVFSEEDSNSAGQLAFAYMKWNNLSLVEANKNKTDGSVLKENFEVEYNRKLNELALKNLSEQEFDKQLRDWLSDALLFEATDEYWESFGEANFGIQFDLFREKGRMDDILTMENHEQKYKELQIQKQQILKKYKQQNDYKEIDVKSISTADKTQMTLIEAQQKALRDDISNLFAISELDMYPPSLDSDSTIRLNQSFHEVFREFIGKGFNEASTDELIKFFTNSDLGLNFEKSTALKKLRDDLKREKDNDFIREQKAYAESLGLDSSNQTDVLRAFLTKNAPLWYRRYDANTAYDDFLKDYNAGNLNTQELVQHFLEGNNNPIIYRGKPLTMMQISPAFKFTLPQEESLQDLISLYKAETNNQNKVKILDRMQGVDGVDEKYLVDTSDITDNAENLQTYIDVMDAQIRRLEKFDSLTKDNLFLRPQYRKSSYERTEAFAKSQGKKQQLKDWFKETFTFTKDDMEDSFRKQVEEVSQKIPKYGFYKLTEAELTDDVFYSIMKGLEDANHYQQRKSHFQDATSLVQALNGLEFKNGKRPTDTNYYKMMQESMDFNFFGKTVTSRLEFEAMGQTFDLTKFVFGIKNMSVKFALAFSPIVAMTNVSAGITQNAIMRAVGRNIYSKSNDRALGVMTKLLPESLKDIGSFDPQSKVNKILYNFGIYNIADRYRNSKFSKTLRLLPETSFGLMAIGNFGLEGQTTLAKLMDIRLIDGKFIDWRRYSTRQKTIGGKTNSEIKSEFDIHSDKSMYDYIQDDGTFNIEKLKADGYNGDIEKDQSLAMTQIRSLVELTTMEIAKHHEGFGARDPWVSFVLSLKKWLVLAMSTNFSGKRYDFELNGQEEGLLYSPKYMFKLLKSYFKDGVAINEAWDQLDEYQQKNIKTSSIIAGLMIGMIGVATMLKSASDDDKNQDNYILQLLTFMHLRTLNETFSSTPLGLSSAIVGSLESPVMAVSSAKAFGDIVNPKNFGETVKTGKYATWNKTAAAIVKATWLKNLYNVSSSETIKQSRETYENFNKADFLHIFNTIPEPEE